MNSKLAIFVNSKHLISSNFCQIQEHMRYRLHIPQTPIIEVAYSIPYYTRSSIIFQYSDVSANRESSVICLLMLVSHSRAYRNMDFMEVNKEEM